MSKVVEIYDSQTGFTEKMAEAVAKGARKVKRVESELLKIGTPFSILHLNDVDAVILGSPVVYGSVTPDMKAFLASMKENQASGRLRLAGKLGGAFGSYAFSGSWVIRELGEEIESLGIKIVADETSVVDGIGRKQPIQLEEKTRKICFELGKTVAEIASNSN